MDGWMDERKRERKKEALFLEGQVSAMGTV